MQRDRTELRQAGGTAECATGLAVGPGGSSPRAVGDKVRRIGRALLRSLAWGLLLSCLAVFALGRLGTGAWEALASPWALHCAVGLATAFVLALLARMRVGAVVGGIAAAWAIAVVAKALGLASPPPPDAVAFRVVSANVLYGNPADDDKTAAIRALGGDIVILIECSSSWSDALRSLADIYPHQEHRPRSDAGGMAIASRHPLRDVVLQATRRELFCFVDAIVECPEGPLRVLGVHPPPPMEGRWTAARNEEITWFAEQARASSLPTVVCGDFNETPYGDAFADFASRSGFRSARAGFWLRGSWPTEASGFTVPSGLRIAIDHCFVSPDLAVRRFGLGPHVGSDHLPIVIDIARIASPQAGAPTGSQPR